MTRASPRLVALCAAGILSLTLIACRREERRFHPPPGTAAVVPAVPQTELQPGPPVRQTGLSRAPAEYGARSKYSSYETNAYEVSQGKTLYNQYNCSGCHSEGGGGMGPPLMDAAWIYGSRPENVFETVVEGRPNGMPAFGAKIVEHQIWQIVAYVRSMSGLLRKDVAPGRSDDMQVRSQEQSTDKARPPQSALPSSAERR